MKVTFNYLRGINKKNMKATEAKRKLCKIRSNLTDDEQKQAIWIAIRAIDTCTENGFIVEEYPSSSWQQGEE